MKTLPQLKEKKLVAVRVDPSLDSQDHVVYFPNKLAKANAQIKRSGFPGLKKRAR